MIDGSSDDETFGKEHSRVRQRPEKYFDTTYARCHRVGDKACSSIAIYKWIKVFKQKAVRL
jgi:hypothetical protein